MSDIIKYMDLGDVVKFLERDGLTPFAYFDRFDPEMIWELFQKLTCPVQCVGYVNSTGWHQECQKRAQEAMEALGFTPPFLDPIPEQETIADKVIKGKSDQC